MISKNVSRQKTQPGLSILDVTVAISKATGLRRKQEAGLADASFRLPGGPSIETKHQTREDPARRLVDCGC